MLWCDECGRVFAWQFTLRAHIALEHTAHRPYECAQCGIKFTLPSTLQVSLSIRCVFKHCVTVRVLITHCVIYKVRRLDLYILPMGF